MASIIEFHTEQIPITKKSSKTQEDLYLFDCPFCGKDQHLYFFPSNTIWDCKVCGKRGNNYNFITLLYDLVCTKNTKPIAEQWDLPRRVFDTVKFNPLNQTFVIPTFKNNKLNNLYKYDEPHNRVIGSPGIPATLMDWVEDPCSEVWICEGHKDKLAGEAIIGQGRDITIVGMPGATSFKEGWASLFNNRDTVIITDADDAGTQGRDKIIGIFKESSVKPRKLRYVKWPEESPKGFDLRDFYHQNRGASYQMLQELTTDISVPTSSVKTKTETIVEDYSCDSYDKALDSLASTYFLTPDIKAMWAMVMASIYSTNLETEQLWIKGIAAPGSGKSVIAKSVSASDHVVSLSTFTGLFSGFRDPDKKDQGLIPVIDGKTLIIKDADALLKQANIQQIMSELRDFYDRNTSVRYRHGLHFNYQDVRATFIMLGTQALRRADQSFLGERLLTLEMKVTSAEEEKIKNKVLATQLAMAMGKKGSSDNSIMASMKGWINHLKARKPDTELTPEFQKELIRLASFTARMRTMVDRDFRGKLQAPADSELPSRLIGQAVTASISLGVVFGTNSPTEEMHKIIRKVYKDTANPRSHRFMICDVILETPNISAQEIVEATGLDRSLVGDELRDLKELNFIKLTKRASSVNPQFSVMGISLQPEIASPLQELT